MRAGIGIRCAGIAALVALVSGCATADVATVRSVESDIGIRVQRVGTTHAGLDLLQVSTSTEPAMTVPGADEPLVWERAIAGGDWEPAFYASFATDMQRGELTVEAYVERFHLASGLSVTSFTVPVPAVTGTFRLCTDVVRCVTATLRGV